MFSKIFKKIRLRQFIKKKEIHYEDENFYIEKRINLWKKDAFRKKIVITKEMEQWKRLLFEKEYSEKFKKFL